MILRNLGLVFEGVKMILFTDLFAGRFGDEHRANGGLLTRRFMEQQSPIVHRLGRDRAGTLTFGRFLANRSVMPEEIFATAGSSPGSEAGAVTSVTAPPALKPSHTDGINSKP